MWLLPLRQCCRRTVVERYCPNSASAVSTRARIGVCAELGKNPLCARCQVLNRERALLLGLVKQAENHLQVASMMTLTVEMLILLELTH